MVSHYRKRISGLLLDRIDIHVVVPRVEYDKLTSDRLGEPSANVRARVEQARDVQRRRFTGVTGTCGTCLHCNARYGADRGAGVLPAGRRGESAGAGGDAVVADEHPGVSPDPEADADHC